MSSDARRSVAPPVPAVLEQAREKLEDFARLTQGSDLLVITGDPLTGAEAKALVADLRENEELRGQLATRAGEITLLEDRAARLSRENAEKDKRLDAYDDFWCCPVEDRRAMAAANDEKWQRLERANARVAALETALREIAGLSWTDRSWRDGLWEAQRLAAAALVGEQAAGECICPRFTDLPEGTIIADLTCPVHGVDGTDPGDVLPGEQAAEPSLGGGGHREHLSSAEAAPATDPEAADPYCEHGAKIGQCRHGCTEAVALCEGCGHEVHSALYCVMFAEGDGPLRRCPCDHSAPVVARSSENDEASTLEARADALVEYGNSLPNGVTTEAFAEAENLRRKARKLRDEADSPGVLPADEPERGVDAAQAPRVTIDLVRWRCFVDELRDGWSRAGRDPGDGTATVPLDVLVAFVELAEAARENSAHHNAIGRLRAALVPFSAGVSSSEPTKEDE